MKKNYKTMIPIGILVIIAIWIYSYFHVSGREISHVERISDDACTVTITYYQHDIGYAQKKEYTLDAAQTEKLKELISKSSFTRVLSSWVEFHDMDMYDIRVDFDDTQYYLLIHSIGNEYISVIDESVSGPFGGGHLKIKNPNWKASLEEIIQSAKGYLPDR